ncbi:MAG TPA: YheC/YheD family protein, partial [Bacillota bacterium]
RRSGDAVVVRSSQGGAGRLPRGALEHWAHSRLRGRLLLQPELQLRDRRGRPFDLRVLVQRDGRGRLAVTGSAVRVGRAGSWVANLHRGGTALTPEAAQDRLPGLAEAAAELPGGSLAVAAHAAALRVTAAIERRWGRFAELGIDLGFDLGRRRLFFLEANTRPGRLIFRKSGDHEARLVSIRRPLEYARFLVRGARPATSEGAGG